MTQIIFQLASGEQRSVEAADGESVMAAALKHNVPGILAECGGSCSCATCHVYVEEQFLNRLAPPSQFEEEMLEGVAAERRLGSRLSCQLPVEPEIAGMHIEIPAVQM